MKKKGMVFSLISGILDILIFLVAIATGALLVVQGFALSANPVANLFSLGMTGAIGFIIAIVGLASIGISIVFLIFGIKTLCIAGKKPETYLSRQGKILAYAIVYTVFFVIGLAGVLLSKQEGQAILISGGAIAVIGIDTILKYAGYFRAKRHKKTLAVESKTKA